MTTRPATVDGYVADSLYPSSFHQPFTPPWTDAILRHHGVQPPRRPRAPFTLLDMGCGDGVGLSLLAAAHPEGRFFGLDALPGHIERGEAHARAVGLSNLTLTCAPFKEALALEGGQADYIACQGVLAWVSPENRAALLDLSAHLLRPGGVLTIGYNCFPGWSPIAGFQRAVRAMASGRDGGPTERFEAALAGLRESGAMGKAIWDWFDPLVPKLSRDYFAHEYLNEHWQPLWADEAIAACAARDLHLAGEARPWRLRPDFALQKAWRAALDSIAEIGARETAMDVMTHNWFRTDIYVKGLPTRLGNAERDVARLEGWWAAPGASDTATYETRTAAGTIRFDNEAARAIMALLDSGPAPLSRVEGLEPADLLNTIDALFMAGLVCPVDPPADVPLAGAINQTIRRMDADGMAMNGLVGRYGAIGIDRGQLATLDSHAQTRLGLGD
jgi:SAM-dependent methyltransferase